MKFYKKEKNVKILAISGSPREGNTNSVLKALKEDYPDIDLKLLKLKEADLQMCRGCYLCFRQGEDKCPIRDDRDKIINEMWEAEGVIMASPVYSIQVSALIKNFFDRLGFYAHRPRFYDKFAMILTTCHGYGGEDAAEYMDKILSSFGFNNVSSVVLEYRPGKTPEEKIMENREKTSEAFETLLVRIEKGERNTPSLGLLVPFILFKEVSQLDKDVMKADYEYYKNKGDFSYDAKIGFLKKALAKKVVKKILNKHT